MKKTLFWFRVQANKVWQNENLSLSAILRYIERSNDEMLIGFFTELGISKNDVTLNLIKSGLKPSQLFNHVDGIPSSFKRLFSLNFALNAIKNTIQKVDLKVTQQDIEFYAAAAERITKEAADKAAEAAAKEAAADKKAADKKEAADKKAADKETAAKEAADKAAAKEAADKAADKAAEGMKQAA